MSGVNRGTGMADRSTNVTAGLETMLSPPQKCRCVSAASGFHKWKTEDASQHKLVMTDEFHLPQGKGPGKKVDLLSNMGEERRKAKSNAE